MGKKECVQGSSSQSTTMVQIEDPQVLPRGSIHEGAQPAFRFKYTTLIGTGHLSLRPIKVVYLNLKAG